MKVSQDRDVLKYFAARLARLNNIRKPGHCLKSCSTGTSINMAQHNKITDAISVSLSLSPDVRQLVGNDVVILTGNHLCELLMSEMVVVDTSMLLDICLCRDTPDHGGINETMLISNDGR